MKKTIALLMICLVSGLFNHAFAAQKIMTVYQRAAGDEAQPHSITGFKDFTPVGTGVAVTNTTITLGGGTANTDGAVWYGGDSDACYCVNGICDFGIGIRAYFEFRFLTVDGSANSQTYGNGFTFAILNGFNNVRNERGGSPTGSGLEALMAYAGPGNTASLGLEPPKMAIEFDTYPNRGTGAQCNNANNINSNRNDANNVNNNNHMALMLWGDNPGGTCSGGYPAVSYDDNRHGAGTAGSNTVPQNSNRLDGTGGYYEVPTTVTWLEDNTVHRFRIEIIRESISTDNIGNYIVKAWVDCPGCTAAQLAAFKDTSLPFITNPTVSPQINRTIELSAALHATGAANFSKMLFGFTQATGALAQAQNIAITNFNLYCPPCGIDEPPGAGWTWCAYENPTPPAPGPFACTFSGGTKLVAYGRNCIYNYRYFTSPVDCSNGVFGDPHVGVYKKCYYK